MCTDFEKRIYNEFLKESRKAKNLPYKQRKNFTKINDTMKLCLNKLSNFFINNKEVNITDFFKAPYHVYPEGETFDLKFFVSPKARGVYKIFTKSSMMVDNTEKDGIVGEVS